MIPAKSSPTHTRDTAARKSANERFSQEKTPDLAKRALQTGSRVPRLNLRRQSCHPQQPQLRRKEPETMADNELRIDRKSTRLNSSHGYISYAVFCLKKKKKQNQSIRQLIVV